MLTIELYHEIAKDCAGLCISEMEWPLSKTATQQSVNKFKGYNLKLGSKQQYPSLKTTES